MLRIALDALDFEEDDNAFFTCAEKHVLTVNEVVYYLTDAGELEQLSRGRGE
jgi:hypothetical protein